MNQLHAEVDECEFGPYRLTKDGDLHCPDGARVHLTSRLACVLSELAAAKGVPVSRLNLIERCWPDVAIQEENLTRAIADLRRIFREHGEDCIETVYGLGYRLNTSQSDHDIRETLAFCQEAWHRVYHRQRATLDSAESLFAEATRKEAGYIPGWLGIAETQIHRMQLGYATTLEAAPKALEALDRALDVDFSSADALAFKGLLLTWAEWDFISAEEALNRACHLAADAYVPNHARAWHELAMGRYHWAERYARIASAAKPLSMTSRAIVAFARKYAGDRETALNVARDMVRIDAHGPVSLSLAAIFEADSGDPLEAVSMATRGYELLPESPVVGAILSYALARAGRADKARALLESRAKTGPRIGSNTMASAAWLELGENALAMTALESGFAIRCPWLLQMLNDPSFERLNCDPLKEAVTASR